MSKWRFGCGVAMTVHIPRGYGYREMTVECGSTSHTGGVNQCDDCVKKFETVEPEEDEGDMEWFERNEDDFDGDY